MSRMTRFSWKMSSYKVILDMRSLLSLRYKHVFKSFERSEFASVNAAKSCSSLKNHTGIANVEHSRSAWSIV